MSMTRLPTPATRAWRSARLALLACLAFICLADPGLAGDTPQQGDTLPVLTLLKPDMEQDSVYLGLEQAETFTLADAAYDFMLFEVIGVYCPFCHEQTPLFNDLFKRIQRSGLEDRVKIIAVASGATAMEAEYLRDHSKYAYPVLRDEDFSLHKALGEPKTPFTMILDRQGVVLFTHTGVIEDIDQLFLQLKGLAK